MTKLLATLVAILYLVSACAEAETAASDGASSVTADDDTSGAEDEESNSDQTAESQSDESQDSTDEPNAPSAEEVSLNDLPEVCRDLLATFLRDIEPIVASVDLNGASLDDLAVALEALDEPGDAFEASIEENAECADLALENQDFDQLIAFAEDVAPGTVPYLQLTASIMDSTPDSGSEGSSAAGCEDTLAAFAELAATYDSAQEAPVADLMSAQSGIMNCSAGQLAQLGEYADFLGG